MIRYPSIDQFRNAIGAVHKLSFQQNCRRDADGNPIEGMLRNWKFPEVVFTGTVKLHGTNAAVVVRDGVVGYQSRNRDLTPDDDNAGFAAWASQHEAAWQQMAAPFGNLIVYGEWCGGTIQHGVALTGLPTMFVIFEGHVVDGDYIDIAELAGLPPQTFKSTDFPTWTVAVDMENPQLVQNELVAITLAVEEECPVGKHFGVSGVGEGVVWSADVLGHRIRFKVKGDKHSSHRVRTLAAITAENPGTMAAFVEDALSARRLEQGIEFLKEHGLPIAIQSTGDFARWVVGDVVKEESDTMEAAGLDVGIAKKKIGSAAANRFKTSLWQLAA
ncbi:RNA ligase family protein [Pararhizobium sp.]|uniref:RNA ligase family protein n=1 Tax=Pararhizobium sp. TaxID=1977563 RepID=UPI003D0D5F26